MIYTIACSFISSFSDLPQLLTLSLKTKIFEHRKKSVNKPFLAYL
nr:MAG TPA: hypothetical protein [Caudoviricetes sp.]